MSWLPAPALGRCLPDAVEWILLGSKVITLLSSFPTAPSSSPLNKYFISGNAEAVRFSTFCKSLFCFNPSVGRLLLFLCFRNEALPGRSRSQCVACRGQAGGSFCIRPWEGRLHAVSGDTAYVTVKVGGSKTSPGSPSRETLRVLSRAWGRRGVESPGFLPPAAPALVTPRPVLGSGRNSLDTQTEPGREARTSSGVNPAPGSCSAGPGSVPPAGCPGSCGRYSEAWERRAASAGSASSAPRPRSAGAAMRG